MKLWLATHNKGKVDEFKRLLSGMPVELHIASEISSFSPPPETGKTFLENALIKARSLISVVQPDEWVLADDSGLCVEGLNGLPGVHSARYAGDHASAAENNAKLLKMVQIRTPGNRAAYFECSLVLIAPDRSETIFSGTAKGTIATKEAGKNGFGYDPVFIAEGQTITFAEMAYADKNAISHRNMATQKLKEHLASIL
jgi:XTP/dITP diphosphohydrolase